MRPKDEDARITEVRINECDRNTVSERYHRFQRWTPAGRVENIAGIVDESPDAIDLKRAENEEDHGRREAF